MKLGRAGVIGLGIAVVLLLPALALWLLSTRWAGEQVRNRVEPALDERIAGDLSLGGLRLSLGRIVLTEVALRTPDGQLVFHAPRTVIRFSLPALVRGRLVLTSVRVERPRLDIVVDPGGSNLARALAPTGKPPRTEAGGFLEAVTLRRLELVDGSLHFSDRTGRYPPAILGDVSLVASGRLGLDDRTFSATADLRARATAPLAVPFELHFEADGSADEASAEGRLRFGSSVLAASASLRSGSATVSLRSLLLAPELVQVATGYPLPRAVSARGEVEWRRPVVTGRLHLRNGPGSIDAEGRIELGPSPQARIDARGRNLDLAALVPGGPSTRLSLLVGGQARGQWPHDLRGDLHLEIPQAPVGGRTLGPVKMHLRALDGTLVVETLRARIPGARLAAGGRVTPRRLDLRGELHVTDLGRALALAGELAPPLSGRGRVAARLLGTRSDPRLIVTGGFPRLNVAGTSIAPLSFALAGEKREGALTARLRRLRVTLGRSTWRLRPPALAAYAGGTLSISRLVLESGRQWLALQVRLAPSEIDGTLRLRDVALASLPPGLLPPELPLAGAVSGRVQVEGIRPRPTGKLSLTLVNGRIAHLRPVTATIQATFDAGRVAGRATARSRASRAGLTFDLPLGWPPPPQSRLALRLDVDEVVLRTVLAPLGLPVRGTARATLTASGRAHEPRLALEAAVRGLAVPDHPPGDLAVSLHSGPGGPTTLTLRLTGARYQARAELETALAPTRLLDEHAGRALLRAPFQLAFDATRLPAPLLGRLAGLPRVRAGTVDATGRARGPLRQLQLSLGARAQGISGRGFPATDLDLEARSGHDDGLSMILAARRSGRALLAVRATLDAEPSELVDLDTLSHRPLSLEARFGPLSLQRADLPPLHFLDPPRVLRGRLAAELTASGTLAAPRVRATVRLDQLALDGLSLGHARLLARYQDRTAHVDLTARTGTIGSLHLVGSAGVDLSYPAVLGQDPGAIPVTLALRTDSFDLRCLSGLLPELRLVAGQLDTRIDVRGRLDAPRVRGRLEWRDGAFSLAGLGVYRDVHLLAHATENQVRLDELRAASRGGHLRLTGRGIETQGRDRWLVSASARLRSFPVYSDGQAVATIQGDIAFEGRVGRGGGELEAEVDEAHVRLLDRRGREVQPLRRPDDIIVFRHGRPLNELQAARLRALERPARAAARNEGRRPPEERGFQVRVELDAPRNLWVRGSDVDLELGLGPDFHVVVGEELRIFGSVVVRRGHVEVLSRRFEVRPDSRVLFLGPPDSPGLDVTGTHELGKIDTTVVVTLEGEPEAMTISLRSPEHPEYGDTELLTLLATGRLPDQRLGAVATPSATAASLLGAVLASRVQEILQRRLPLDVIEIAPGEGLTSTRIEAGAYVSDDLYLAYVGRIGEDPFRRENRNEVHLEYQLTRRWSLEATYGDARQGAADLIWTRRY